MHLDAFNDQKRCKCTFNWFYYQSRGLFYAAANLIKIECKFRELFLMNISILNGAQRLEKYNLFMKFRNLKEKKKKKSNYIPKPSIFDPDEKGLIYIFGDNIKLWNINANIKRVFWSWI